MLDGNERPLRLFGGLLPCEVHCERDEVHCERDEDHCESEEVHCESEEVAG